MNKLFLFFVFCILLGCTPKNKTKYQKIEEFVRNHSSNKSLDPFSKVVIINSKEIKCISCDNAFSKFMAKETNNQNTLFIVSENGSTIDISGFLNQKKSNLILDRHEKFSKMNIVDGCAILTLKNHKITDSVIVNYKTIEPILKMKEISGNCFGP